MLNVNEIFRDLALLVHEQGEVIDSIESHIEHAAINVEEGNKQLLRAKTYQVFRLFSNHRVLTGKTVGLLSLRFKTCLNPACLDLWQSLVYGTLTMGKLLQ